MALQHVVADQRLVDKQRALLATLAAHSRSTQIAETLLLQFENAQAMHVADRDRLLAELAPCVDRRRNSLSGGNPAQLHGVFTGQRREEQMTAERGRQVTLAFRLEGVGYDCLHISARAALLCQALAELKLQLRASAGEALVGRPN